MASKKFDMKVLMTIVMSIAVVIFVVSLMASPENDITEDSSLPVQITGAYLVNSPVSMVFDGPEVSNTADYRLDVTFLSPTGAVQTVHGSYVDDAAWGIDFTPVEAGEWTYVANFRTGENIDASANANAGVPTGFDGLSGTFMIGQ